MTSAVDAEVDCSREETVLEAVTGLEIWNICIMIA